MCLGDMNGRLKSLEPQIETDNNGKMVEEWTKKFNLHHLNLSEKCIGLHTICDRVGRKSAIDHILINGKMMESFKGMSIDDNKELLNISDHCLARAWFSLGEE